MLYLMLDKGDGRYFVKCGFSSSPKRRLNDYTTHNPTAIMRSTCAGTRSTELLARKTLASMSICRIKSSEWFEVTQEVFNLFYAKGMEVLRPAQHPIHFVENFS